MDESDFSEDNEGEEAKEEELDPENPEHAFPILERDFNKTVAELEQDINAAQYADEFYKLFEFLYQTYQSHKLLEEKYSDSLKQLEDRDERIDLGIKLAAMDKETMNDLQTQIEHSWKLADAAHLREQLAQEIIENLRRQIEALNAEIEFKNKMSQETNEEMGQANKKKDSLEREKEKLVGEVNLLNQKLHNALEYQIELEKKNSSADLRINEINGQLEDQSHEIDRIKRIRDKLDDDIAELNGKVEEKDVQINELYTTITTHTKQVTKLESVIKEEKASKEKIMKEHDSMTMKYTKLQDEHNFMVAKYDDLNQRFNKRILDLKTAEDEVMHLKNDLSKVTKVKDIAEKRYFALDQEKNEMIQDRNKLRQRIAMFEREIDDFKKQIDSEKREIEAITKEKDFLSKAALKNEAVQKDQQKLIKIQTVGKKKLEAELDNLIMENSKFSKVIRTLEREKEHLAEDQLLLTKRIETAMDEIKLKKAEIYDLKKSETEHENRFKMQQNLFDAVRSERNAMEKTLQEMAAESGELKKKLKMSNHQIEQLKEDISSKEQQLIKEENIFRKLLKEKENLKIELNVASDTIKTLKVEISEKDDEERRLHKTIMDNDRVIRQQVKELEQLMNERDILGSQLVRRNDEIALLHEKIVILQTTLQRGESQYVQRLEDIKLLKIEIRRLRQEKKLLTKSVNNAVDLKQEVFHLERDLTRSRLKCRALEEELQNPLNVHRWRKLEGSDPELLDLLQKIQLLQKRLLRQSSEAVEKERQLKEIEKLYGNLKKVLSKQPGPAIQEELNKTQRALKFRGEKLKCLVSELNMAELQAKEYKSDLQRVTEELKVIKQKYLADKKAQRYQKTAYENSKPLNQNRNRDNSADPVKFTGGGFRMSVDSVK